MANAEYTKGTGGSYTKATGSGTAGDPWIPEHTVSASALPTGAATAAKQPALGTAGTPSADVISVQGVSGGTAIPISVASLPSQAVTNAGTFATQVTTQVGAANIATDQVSVTTSSASLVASRATRRSVTIVNHGTTAVYLKGGTVTTSNGVLLPGVIGAAITFNTTSAIHGIVASGTQTVSYVEEYD